MVVEKEEEEEEKLTESQIRIMSREIGELLAKLKKDNVFDLKESLPIILIDRTSSNIEFKRNEILQVKRFTSLIRKYLQVLSYLSTHPTFDNIIVEIKRSDRIAGSVNLRKTILAKQRAIQKENSLICSEIRRKYETPENLLVVIILISIISYCDKFIKLSRLVESIRRIDPTISELRIIRNYVQVLLSKQLFRKILPIALEYRNNMTNLIEEIKTRIKQQKISVHFTNIFKLFYEWNYFISISFNDEEITKHVLYYHFMNLASLNDLFECWVFVKVLNEISNIFDLKLNEVNSRKGVCTFVSKDKTLRLIYQAKIFSKWKDEFYEFYDYPDIVLEFSNGRRIIIDAKNSKYEYNNPRPNFDQMRSYLKSTDADLGFFIHSNSQKPNLWYKISDVSNTKQIIWTTLIPGHTNEISKKFFQLIYRMK
jgi:hypothetical protein